MKMFNKLLVMSSLTIMMFSCSSDLESDIQNDAASKNGTVQNEVSRQMSIHSYAVSYMPSTSL